MKKKKIIILLIMVIIIGVIIFLISFKIFNKLYRYNKYDDVFDYGKELSIYEILGNDINISEYSKLSEYKYKKAKVKSIGSTAHMNIKVDNNDIVFIGNRNLVKINDVLYSYSEDAKTIAENISDIKNSIEQEGVISNIIYKIHNNYSQGRYDYSKRGYYVGSFNTPNAPWFYIITMGTQNSGGYSIEIVDLKIDSDRNVKVTVKETTPNGEAVTMALIYPAVCLELSEYANSIEITNTNGEIFQKLN